MVGVSAADADRETEGVPAEAARLEVGSEAVRLRAAGAEDTEGRE